MDQPFTPLPREEISAVRGEKPLRALHRCVPLGRQYHPLMSTLNAKHGLFALPVGPAHLLMPASWPKSAAHMLLLGQDSFPGFELEFWTFEHRQPRTKLGRSLAKCRPARAHRYTSVAECLQTANSPAYTGVIYCLGRSRA